MFVEKLNKKQDGVYVIEEEKDITDGKWEGYLDHDNARHQSIVIYTGPNFTGEKVDNFFASTPSETPWKTHLKVFSESEKIYIIYETTGDQVEAEDINLLQDSLVEEIDRAITEETRIDTKLDSEIDRSVNMDNTLNRKINNEVERSEAVDIDLNNKITSEIERSKQQDQIITTNLINETNRAKDAENKLKQDIINEEARAINKENEIKGNLNSHIDNYNNQVLALKEKDSKLERDKADKVYVDAELNKKYNKDEVFTKDEVLQRIQDIIGAAPEALDTLEELARALDNDPNFATNIINLLGTKVDKVDGKQLSTNDFTNLLKAKLDSIEDGANKYIHPDTHPASMIVESSARRFVSDTEKANWDSKETPIGAQSKAATAESNAKSYTDSHASDTVKHITATERTNWDDANSKKHTHSNKSALDKITQALIDGWNSAVEHIKDSVRHITSAERTKWNSKAEGVHKHKTDDITDFPTEMTPKYTAIPSGADLNDFTEIGFYGTADNSIGNTIVNSPVSGGFSLIVVKRGEYTNQMIINWNPGNPYMWIRSYSNVGGWGEWYKVPFEKDIPTKLSQLTKDINFDERYYTESEVDNKLNSKVDKVTGKGLSSNDYTTTEKQKLEGIEEGANKYIHPDTHPASIITESTTKRFVSDTEKAKWNGKADISDIPTKVGQLENDKNYVTSAELGNAGYGDMMKSTYDKNDDGIVDVAETVIGNEIQLGSYKLVYNSTTNSLDIEVVA